MALLTDPDRAVIHADYMRDNEDPFGVVTKQELRDAVNATDQWISDNASSYNQALPLAARNALTAAQKARLFWFVARRRFIGGV